MGTESYKGIYDITITKAKRVWCDVTVHRKSKTDIRTRVKKEAVAGLPIGEKVTVYGEVVWENNGYGATSTFDLISTDIGEGKRQAAEHYMDLLRKTVHEKGYISDSLISKIEGLGQLDAHRPELKQLRQHLAEVKRQEEIEKWASYFRRNFNDGNGYIYHRAIEELHTLGYHDMDAEIEAAKETIRQRKQEEKERKRREEKENGIVRLSLPAPFGFRGKPTEGQVITEKGRVYKTISSYYHDSDGWSFGVPSEEWYSVKAQDITDTEEGKAILDREAREAATAAAKRRYERSITALERAIKDKGARYTPDVEHPVCDDVPGETVVDTFDIYGFGVIIKVSDDAAYAIINNGSDGAFWGINDIHTGGAGAYDFRAALSDVKDAYDEFLDAKAQVKED